MENGIRKVTIIKQKKPAFSDQKVHRSYNGEKPGLSGYDPKRAENKVVINVVQKQTGKPAMPVVKK
jgi:hypothetical protein